MEQIKSVLGPIVSTTVIPATTKKFIAEDNFKVNTSKNAKVKISYLGDNFFFLFLEKIEEAFAGSIIYGRHLNHDSLDDPIICELGDEKQAKTTLTEIFTMMERQAKGEEGELLNDGRVNIFYVEDVKGILWTVGVSLEEDGWFIDADSVDDFSDWEAGCKVFSRKPSVA